MTRQMLEHITVADLLAHAATGVDAHCVACGHLWWVSVDFMPKNINLAHVASLLICPVCESGRIEISPTLGLDDSASL